MLEGTTNNVPAEESVLGACLWSTAVARQVVQVLTVEDFWLEKHRIIFRVVQKLVVEGKDTDHFSIIAELKRQNLLEAVDSQAYIVMLHGCCANDRAWGHFADCIKSATAARSISDLGAALETISGAEDLRGGLDTASEKLQAVARRLDGEGPTHISEGVDQTFENMLLARESGSRITGLETGFKELDATTGGLQPGNLIVVGGRTSMGKTSLALNVVHHVAVKEQRPVLIFSLEMNKSEIGERLICQEARVDSLGYRSGNLTEPELLRVEAARSLVSAAPIQLDDRGDRSVDQMRVIARQQMPALIIVDYIQLMYSGKTENRAQDVSRIARDLKVMATEQRVPVIAVSQLRRPGAQLARKEPMLEDLKESGGIEQNADLVLLIYRPEVDDPGNDRLRGIADINLAKNRTGPCRKMRLYWVASYCTFINGRADEPANFALRQA